jgi:hypothetical protein
MYLLESLHASKSQFNDVGALFERPHRTRLQNNRHGCGSIHSFLLFESNEAVRRLPTLPRTTVPARSQTELLKTLPILQLLWTARIGRHLKTETKHHHENTCQLRITGCFDFVHRPVSYSTRKYRESAHMACLTNPISQPCLHISPIWIPLTSYAVANSQRRSARCNRFFIGLYEVLVPSVQFLFHR